MTEPTKTPSAAEFDACCRIEGITLASGHKQAVLTTAQWLAAGLAKLRQSYPDAGKAHS